MNNNFKHYSVFGLSGWLMLVALFGSLGAWLFAGGLAVAKGYLAERLSLAQVVSLSAPPVSPTSLVASPLFPAPPSMPRLTLAFVGDIMLDRGVLRSVIERDGDFDWLFAGVRELASADILFGNLEGPLSDRGRDRGHLYGFRMAPVAAAALRQAGFAVLSVANNHSGDWGPAAFVDTLYRLNAAGIQAVGGGLTKTAAASPAVIEAAGLKIGFLASSDVGAGELAAGESTPGIILASDPEWPEMIRRAAGEVDILIVSYHFGDEYQTTPNSRQRELARLAFAQGAQLVIGHHPHVVQPVEQEGGGLVAYSLGNFIFDQNFSAATMRGLALLVTIVGDEITVVAEREVAITPSFQPTLR